MLLFHDKQIEPKIKQIKNATKNATKINLTQYMLVHDDYYIKSICIGFKILVDKSTDLKSNKKEYNIWCEVNNKQTTIIGNFNYSDDKHNSYELFISKDNDTLLEIIKTLLDKLDYCDKKEIEQRHYKINKLLLAQ